MNMYLISGLLSIISILLLQTPKTRAQRSSNLGLSETNNTSISEPSATDENLGSQSEFIVENSLSSQISQLSNLNVPKPTPQNYANVSKIQREQSDTIVVAETKWLESSGFPLWLAILILTTVGSLLALATLVCSIKFKQKERQLQTLRARLKQQQQQSSSSQGSKYTNQRCMCLIALDQQRHKLQTSDVDAPTTAAA